MSKGRQQGFTLIEALIAIAIMGIILVTITFSNSNGYNQRQAKLLAQETKIYADAFAPYLQDLDESNIYVILNGSSCVRADPFTDTPTNNWTYTAADLQRTDFGTKYEIDEVHRKIICTPKPTSYWNNIYKGHNSYEQVPCVAVEKDASGSLHGLLYFVDTEKSSKHFNAQSKLIIRSAVTQLGAAAGYVDKGMVIGGNWSIPVDDDLFTKNNRCSGMLNEHSIVFLLDEYMNANNALNDRLYISREQDKVFDLGDIRNKNTSKTDILMNNHQIVLDKDKNIVVKQNENKIEITGSVQSDSFMAVELADSGSVCSSNEVGKIKRQKDEALRDLGMQTSTVVCSNAPVVCHLYGNSDYCYLPTKKSTIRYSDEHLTGKLGTVFDCPAAMPYMKSAEAVLTNGTPAKIKERGYQLKGYNIIRGAEAYTDAAQDCLKWQFSYQIASYQPQFRMCIKGNSQNVGCNVDTTASIRVCLNGQQAGNVSVKCNGTDTTGGVYNWICTQKNINKPMLKHVVCSNKYFVDVQ